MLAFVCLVDTLPMDLPMDLNDVLSEYGGMADDGKDEEEILGEDATEEEKRESMQRQVQRQVLAVRRGTTLAPIDDSTFMSMEA